MNINKDVEKSICREFINSSNVIPSYNTTYSLIEEDREAPDFLLQDSKGTEIGLEITSAYHDQDRAKGFWKTLRSDKEGIFDSFGNCITGRIPLNNVMLNPNEMIASFVRKRLDDKCLMAYEYQTILVIFISDPLWNDRKLKLIREIPKSLKRNPFPVIYICVVVPHSSEFSPNAGKWTFYRIYPSTNKLHNLDQVTYKKLKYNFEKRCKQVENKSSKDIKAMLKDEKQEAG
jgi:hypothetical protein